MQSLNFTPNCPRCHDLMEFTETIGYAGATVRVHCPLCYMGFTSLIMGQKDAHLSWRDRRNMGVTNIANKIAIWELQMGAGT